MIAILSGLVLPFPRARGIVSTIPSRLSYSLGCFVWSLVHPHDPSIGRWRIATRETNRNETAERSWKVSRSIADHAE